MTRFAVNTGMLEISGRNTIVIVENAAEVKVDDQRCLEFTDLAGNVIAGFREWAHYQAIEEPEGAGREQV
jgi:hypothetical protein